MGKKQPLTLGSPIFSTQMLHQRTVIGWSQTTQWQDHWYKIAMRMKLIQGLHFGGPDAAFAGYIIGGYCEMTNESCTMTFKKRPEPHINQKPMSELAAARIMDIDWGDKELVALLCIATYNVIGLRSTGRIAGTDYYVTIASTIATCLHFQIPVEME